MPRCLCLAAVLLGLIGRPAAAQSLEAVRAEGHLACGVTQAVDDWNDHDQHGSFALFGTEICRAVAIAIFGDAAKMEVVGFPAEPEALGALKGGSIALAVGLSPSVTSAVQYGVAFSRPVFLDTERFLVPEALGFKSIADLRGRLVCAMDSTDAERTLQDEMAARRITFGLQSHSEQGEMDASVAVAHCAAGAALETRLAQSRADFPAKAPPFTFLPERLSLEPVAAAWRYGDQKFGLLVNATISALIEAEALKITQADVGESLDRHDMRADRLLGHDRSIGNALGLPADWAVHVIAAVGNYGEIFDRTFGKSYGLARGVNALWTSGGLLYPTPLR